KNIKKLFKAVAKGREGFDKLNHTLCADTRTGRVTVNGFSKTTARYLLNLFGGDVASNIDRAVAIGGSAEINFMHDRITVDARDAKGSQFYWHEIPRQYELDYFGQRCGESPTAPVAANDEEVTQVRRRS